MYEDMVTTMVIKFLLVFARHGLQQVPQGISPPKQPRYPSSAGGSHRRALLADVLCLEGPAAVVRTPVSLSGMV